MSAIRALASHRIWTQTSAYARQSAFINYWGDLIKSLRGFDLTLLIIRPPNPITKANICKTKNATSNEFFLHQENPPKFALIPNYLLTNQIPSQIYSTQIMNWILCIRSKVSFERVLRKHITSRLATSHNTSWLSHDQTSRLLGLQSNQNSQTSWLHDLSASRVKMEWCEFRPLNNVRLQREDWLLA